MDPNETLRKARATVAAIRKWENEGRAYMSRPDYDDLVDAFEALDEWLTKGGFHPREWSHQTPREFSPR